MFVSSPPPVKKEIPILIHSNGIRRTTFPNSVNHHVTTTRNSNTYTPNQPLRDYDTTNQRKDTSTPTDYSPVHLQEPLVAAIGSLPPLPSLPVSSDAPENDESKLRAVQIIALSKQSCLG
jgi:hypothetical protein